MLVQIIQRYINWQVGEQRVVPDAVAEKLIAKGVAKAVADSKPAEPTEPIDVEEKPKKSKKK